MILITGFINLLLNAWIVDIAWHETAYFLFPNLPPELSFMQALAITIITHSLIPTNSTSRLRYSVAQGLRDYKKVEANGTYT